jgi:hypothetical protein
MYKTLLENEARVSKYLFNNDAEITLNDSNIEFLGEVVDTELNSSNSTLVSDVTPPDDWIGKKYIYTEEGTWIQNPNDPSL